MRPARRARPGLSLTEVLVAMFVMALGLMALLTLFPLGAMQIGQALKDDRTAQAARQADAWLRAYWRAESTYQGSGPAGGLPRDGLLGTFDDANVTFLGSNMPSAGRFSSTVGAPFAANILYTLPAVGGAPNNPLTPPTGPAPSLTTFPTSLTAATMRQTTGAGANDDGLGTRETLILEGAALPDFQRYLGTASRSAVASYPVLFDPLGCLTRGPGNAGRGEQFWAGYRAVYGLGPTATPLLVPRRNPRATSDGRTATEYRTDPIGSPSISLTVAQHRGFATCCLSDDLSYQPNGGAGNGTEPLNRQGRYTWAAVVQRPHNSDVQQASLTVLVFDGRPVNLAPAGDEVVLVNDPANNLFFHTGATAGNRSLVLNVPARGADQPPLVRRGGWVGVASMDGPAVPNAVRGLTFHRITGLTTSDETTQQRYAGGPVVAVTPVSADIDPPLPTRLSATPQVYLFAGLSEVFERPALTP